jgi:uncharacterized protein YndB with AHSA1/START domain
MTQAAIVVKELHIDAAPEEVFPYFVDADKLATWKAVAAATNPAVGGTYRMDVTGQGDVAIGSYLEVDPPYRVVFTLAWEGNDPSIPPGTVEVTLTPKGEGTWLRLVHRGPDPSEGDHSGYGWDHYLTRLVQVVRGQDPGPDPWAKPTTDAVTENGR